MTAPEKPAVTLTVTALLPLLAAGALVWVAAIAIILTVLT